ncbi:MAG: glutathione S-transferase family protein [Vicinamibacterales bacterium]
MKLYFHPVSTVSRPVALFATDNDIKLDYQVIDLMTGEHLKESYATINPSRLVPVLEEGDFRLTESSAILKYLADKIGSPAYPKDLQKRARVNEMMDWLNTGFYRDLGYGLVYPQIFPHHHRRSEEAHAGAVEWGKEKTKGWLQVLDQQLLGSGKKYLCGDDITIADYLGAGMLSLTELIHCDLAPYPNLTRWYESMKARPNWKEVNKTFYGFVGAMKDKSFETTA